MTGIEKLILQILNIINGRNAIVSSDVYIQDDLHVLIHHLQPLHLITLYQVLDTSLLQPHGLAYVDEVAVNWCPALGTVLSNEEVVDGVSERGGYRMTSTF
jgi:hypothetical protein